MVNERGRFLWANFAASELLGYRRDELAAGSLGTTGPIVEAITQLVRENGEHAEGEARLPRQDGTRLFVRWNLWALPKRQERPEFLLSISLAPQTSPEGLITAGYRDIFEFAVEGIFRVTIEGQFIEVNPALAAIFGYGDPVAFMSSVDNLYEQLYVDPARRKEFLRHMLHEGYVSGFEAEMYAAGQTTVWVGIFARTVRAASGAPLYFEGSLIDITERKKTENALRWSEERFRRLAETTRVVPFEYEPDAQVFKYVGPQAEALFGPEFRRGLTFARWCELVHPDDMQEATRFAQEPTEKNSSESHTEFRLISMGEGTDVWVKQIFQHAETQGKGTNVRGFLFEITEGKLAEMERERSRAQLRELAAQAHLVREEERISVAREIHDELGQALTLLKMELAWLTGRLSNLGNEELVKPLAEKIGSMEQLIHWTLQSVRRILSSLRPPLLDEAGIKEAIQFHLENFAKRAAIRHQYNANSITPLPVNTATAIFRIFQEILTNVARHANATRLTVKLHETGGFVILSVQDNGCGITQQKLSHSRGFGLLGMQERAWAIGGELEIQGSPRSGTRVVLKVPASAAAPGQSPTAGKQAHGNGA